MITLGVMNWSNAFSYGPDNTIDFSKHNLLQLIGKNGHGKSSVALILEEILFNKNSKGIKKADILNRHGSATKYTIDLTFTKDTDTYKIKTSRGSTQTVSISKNGEDISSHTSTGTYKLIEEIIGFDHKTFTQIVYQSSAYSLEFLVSTDTNRKKFLIDLLNLSVYTRASDLFKNITKEVSLDAEKLNVRVKTLDDWINKLNKESLVKKDLLIVPTRPEKELRDYSSIIEQLNNIDSINKKISQNNSYKDILAKLNPVVIPAPTIDITALKIKQSELNKEYKKLTLLLTGTGPISDKCSMCGAPLDNSHKKTMLEEAETRLNTVTLELKQINLELTIAEEAKRSYDKSQEVLSNWEKYHSLIDPKLDKVLLDRKELELSSSNIKDIISKTDAEIIRVTKYNTDAIAHNTKIEVISKQLVDLANELLVERNKLATVQDHLANLSILQKTFSTTGLVAYKIECLVKDLEELTNKYLVDMSDGRFQISFKISSSDKLNVIITDNGTDIDILALSNGERARVNIATLLAIRSLMQSLSNSRINLLILDETVESLDMDGKDKLVEILLQEENLNTVLVSHSFTHPLIEKLYIIKEDNISRIE